MLKALIVSFILLFAQLVHADFTCSLRRGAAGKVMSVLSSSTTEKCLPDCKKDIDQRLETRLTELREALKSLTKENVDSMSYLDLSNTFKQYASSHANNISKCLLAERNGNATREQTKQCLNRDKSGLRMKNVQNAFEKYQNASVRVGWHSRFVDIGFSSAMACAIQDYQLENDVFILIGSQSTVSSAQRDAVLRLISKRTESPAPPGEELGLCKAFKSNQSIPNAFSHAIMQNCL